MEKNTLNDTIVKDKNLLKLYNLNKFYLDGKEKYFISKGNIIEMPENIEENIKKENKKLGEKYLKIKKKIADYYVDSIEHFIFFCFGLYLFYKEKWFWNINLMDEKLDDINSWIFYLFYFSRYFMALTYLIIDEKKKNFISMLIHHCYTLLLLAVSYNNFRRIGIMIAITHDIVDIFLNISKGSNFEYQLKKKKLDNILSKSSLFCFVITWIPTRLIFNYKILKYIFESREVNYYMPIDQFLAICLLFINFTMQIFWTIRIILFIKNIIIGKVSIDEEGKKYKIE